MVLKVFGLMILALIIAGLFLNTATETKLVVDTSRGEILRVNVYIRTEFYNFSMLLEFFL